MKINKKIKTSLISALTLFASAVSVVACDSKDNKSEGDANYKAFLSKITAKDFKPNNFIADYTSLNLYIHSVHSGGITGYETYSPETSFLQDDKVKFFDISNKDSADNVHENSKNLTDLKNGGIQYNGNDIVFNLDGKPVPIENILFYENFDIDVSVDPKYYSQGGTTTFKNITLFFRINTDKSKTDFSVGFKKWEYPEDEFFIQDVTSVNIDGVAVNSNSFKLDDLHLGLNANNSGTYTYWNFWNWHDDFTLNGNWNYDESYSRIWNNFSTIKENDGINMSEGNIAFYSSNAIFFCQFNGAANIEKGDPYDIAAKFMVLIDENNMIFDKNSNFYLEFSGS